LPQRDALTHPAVERAEVLLDLAKIGYQRARKLDELLEALFQRCVVEQRQVTVAHARDLRIDLITPAFQLSDAHGGIGLAAGIDLPQQLEQGQ
jgi:hypothetical protein